MLPIENKNFKSLRFLVWIFVSLDFLVLGTNFYLSHQLEDDAQEINIAGRQRMLSQSISKNVYQWIRDVQGQDKRAALSLNDLLGNAATFEQTLSAFQQGGMVPSTEKNAEPVYLRAVETNEQQRIVSEGMKLWKEWRWQIYDAVSAINGSSSFLPEGWRSPPETAQSLASPLFNLELFTRKQNTQMLDLMNQLTLEKQKIADQHTLLIRLFQLSVFFLVLVNFGYIVRQFFSHLAISSANQSILDSVVDNIDASVVVADENNMILHANKTAVNFLRLTDESMHGRRMNALVEPYKGSCFTIAHNHPETGLEELSYAKILSRPMRINDQQYHIFTLTDVTHEIITQRMLVKLAYEDPLTGLSNRKMIEDKMDQAIKKAKRYDESFALLYLDLDGFKQVNDNYGHDIGDALLVRVGQILKSVLRESDEAGRVGGDEFIVLCANIVSESEVSVICNKILESIQAITSVERFRINVTASIGVAMYPLIADNKRDLKKAADTAMYKAKKDGKNRFCIGV